MEQLRDEVSRVLLALEKPELIFACLLLKCSMPSGGLEKEARRALIRLAEKTLDDIEDEEVGEAFHQYLQHILSELKSLQTKEPSESETVLHEPSELDVLKEKYLKLQEEQNEARRLLEEEIVVLEGRQQPKEPAVDTRTVIMSPPPLSLPEVTLRREFRICGQIGEPGQKEKISYTSLVNQIETGQRKGHSEAEIIEAVTRAVSPGLHLRDMLEIKRGLTLPKLKTILRGHYKVDSSSDLLHRLMNITQDPKESAQTFLFRAIELKEKLMWSLSNENADEQFSPELIQRKFLRSLETGLYSDAVKFQIKPYLSSPSVTDEDLIERINEAANLEQERQQKLKKTVMSKPPRLSEIHTEVSPHAPQLPFRRETEPPDDRGDPTNTAEFRAKSKKGQGRSTEQDSTSHLIEGFRAELLEIKKLVLETAEANKKTQTDRTSAYTRNRPRGCGNCQEAQIGESCRHCFKCGHEGHLSRGCRQGREQQGNERGLLSRDSR